MIKPIDIISPAAVFNTEVAGLNALTVEYAQFFKTHTVAIFILDLIYYVWYGFMVYQVVIIYLPRVNTMRHAVELIALLANGHLLVILDEQDFNNILQFMVG